MNREVLVEDEEPSSEPSLEFTFINRAAHLQLRQSDACAWLFLGAGPIVAQDFWRVPLRVGKVGTLGQSGEVQSEMRNLFTLDGSDVNAVGNPESCEFSNSFSPLNFSGGQTLVWLVPFARV